MEFIQWSFGSLVGKVFKVSYPEKEFCSEIFNLLRYYDWTNRSTVFDVLNAWYSDWLRVPSHGTEIDSGTERVNQPQRKNEKNRLTFFWLLCCDWFARSVPLLISVPWDDTFRPIFHVSYDKAFQACWLATGQKDPTTSLSYSQSTSLKDLKLYSYDTWNIDLKLFSSKDTLCYTVLRPLHTKKT